MFQRLLADLVRQRLAETSAVALLGPRQVGKTTLALSIAEGIAGGDPASGAIYLDLESEQDRARLVEPEAYLAARLDRLVIIDEVHRAPGLFPILRGLIDRGRRSGRRAGLYLLLGSAGLDLLRQSGESLAGRIAFLELTPFNVLEIATIDPRLLWLRGGFPESLLAANDAQAMRWRLDFIRTYLERDVSQFAPRIPSETLRRFWVMLAHRHGAPLNLAGLARSLDVDGKTIARYVDLFTDLMLVRRLPPWHANVGKRLIKSPKIYLRDSGIVHALLGIADEETLLAHPIVGASWEGFVIESLLSVAAVSPQPDVTAYFYRTTGGAEIDLLLAWPGDELWAIEIKRSVRPKPDRGFHEACNDLRPARRFVVYEGSEAVPAGAGVTGIPLAEMAALVRAGP